MKKIFSILLIDDSSDERLLAKMIFKKLDCCQELFFAANGREAIEFLADYKEKKDEFGNAFPPILILLDINMPIMNGFEFLDAYKEFHEDPRYKNSLIMMYSSSVNPEDHKKSFSFPFVTDYIEKPMTKEKLENTWAKYFPEDFQ